METTAIKTESREQIRQLFSGCIRNGIRIAMEAAYGNDAFAMYRSIDMENAEIRKAQGRIIANTTDRIDGFDRMDTLICLRTLYFNGYREVQAHVLETFGIDPNDFRDVQQNEIRNIMVLRSLLARTSADGAERRTLTDEMARLEDSVVSKLFPGMIDPQDPQQRTYSAQIRALLSDPGIIKSVEPAE